MTPFDAQMFAIMDEPVADLLLRFGLGAIQARSGRVHANGLPEGSIESSIYGLHLRLYLQKLGGGVAV